MLTSFFSKSKPINFTFVAVYMLLFYLIARFRIFEFSSFADVLTEFLVLVLFLTSLAVLNFIAKRNELTNRNAYKTLLFASFSCMLFQVLQSNEVIIANFFVLLALRRLVSLRTQRESIKKVFDASFWIFIASLFYFWSILFLLLVFIGIFLHLRQNLNSWLVPLLSFLTVLSLATCADLLLNDSFYTFSEWFQPSDFDFVAYRNIKILVPVSLLLALTIWTSFYYISVLQRASANIRASHTLVLWSIIISLATAFLAATKDSSELFFLLGPLAVVVTNYMQAIEDKWFKEVLLIIFLIMPFLVWWL